MTAFGGKKLKIQFLRASHFLSTSILAVCVLYIHPSLLNSWENRHTIADIIVQFITSLHSKFQICDWLKLTSACNLTNLRSADVNLSQSRIWNLEWSEVQKCTNSWYYSAFLYLAPFHPNSKFVIGWNWHQLSADWLVCKLMSISANHEFGMEWGTKLHYNISYFYDLS